VAKLPSSVALLQGGLANQLLQAALISHEEQISIHRLSISDTLLTSRVRKFRGVSKRSISQLFASQILPSTRYNYLISRIRLRIPLFRETLYDGSLFRIHSPGQHVYKGDGLTPNVFSPKYNNYWVSVLQSLDQLFGVYSSPSYISVHVRWGDYSMAKTQIGTGLYPLPVSYYLSAISYLEGSGVDSTNLVFFSDSPDQVQEAFKPALRSPFRVSRAGSAEEDLWKMSFSSNLILSNSTLSCVAAHLSKLRNTLGKAVAPSRWFLRDDFHPRFDLRQPDWIQLQ
jgi:hypothetical protein